MRTQPLQAVKSPARLDDRQRRIRYAEHPGNFEPGPGSVKRKLQPIKLGSRAAKPVRCEAGFSLRFRNQSGSAVSQCQGLRMPMVHSGSDSAAALAEATSPLAR